MTISTDRDETTLRATWTFRRDDDRLEMCRDASNGADARLMITGPGGCRTITCTSVEALITFQQNMESFLVRTNWCLVAFEPERRSGRDRRTFPRIDVDRRRWWTDVWTKTGRIPPVHSD